MTLKSGELFELRNSVVAWRTRNTQQAIWIDLFTFVVVISDCDVGDFDVTLLTNKGIVYTRSYAIDEEHHATNK